jgi:hypothetical protein
MPELEAISATLSRHGIRPTSSRAGPWAGGSPVCHSEPWVDFKVVGWAPWWMGQTRPDNFADPGGRRSSIPAPLLVPTRP